MLAAEELHFRERSVLLSCLLDVVKVYSASSGTRAVLVASSGSLTIYRQFRISSSISPSLRDLLFVITNELQKDGLMTELFKYLSNQPGGLPNSVLAPFSPASRLPLALRDR